MILFVMILMICYNGHKSPAAGHERQVLFMSHTTSPRWGVWGTGAIAHEMARSLLRRGAPPLAVAGRTPEHVAAFQAEFSIPRHYPSLEALLADPVVDILYVATPHSVHAPAILQALEAGKHVLCEKSITLNSEQLSACAALARQKGLVLGEAMTLYHMPLLQHLKARVAGGELGQVRLIQVNFGSLKPYSPANRFFDPALAGGALLDIGVYALALARFFLPEQPGEVLSQVDFAPTGVDRQASILLRGGGAMASVTLTLQVKQPKRALIACEKGYIEIPDYPRADRATVVDGSSGGTEHLTMGESALALDYEARAMEEAVAQGGDMFLPLTTDVMDLMTSLRTSWGLRYPNE